MEAFVHPQLIMLNCIATRKKSDYPGPHIHAPGFTCVTKVV